MDALDYGYDQRLLTWDRGFALVFVGIRDVVAPSDLTVLLLGPSGVGKEGTARAIHWHSRRRGKPFLAINCAELAEGLAVSLLFGHEAGAFTGAVGRHKGFFETVNGGTLFLDEVGDLSPDIQAKLLRVLEQREILRVGASAAIRTDVRVVAATNKNLAQMVAAGTFREDLYYRLSGCPIRLPALRDRPADVLGLALHFARVAATVAGRRVKELDADFRAWLLAQRWRGNVRELEALMKNTVAWHLGAHPECDAIGLHDLPSGAFEREPPLPEERPAETEELGQKAAVVVSITGRVQVHDQRAAVLDLLRVHGSMRVVDVASVVGASARSMRRLIEKLATEGLVRVDAHRGRGGSTVCLALPKSRLVG